MGLAKTCFVKLEHSQVRNAILVGGNDVYIVSSYEYLCWEECTMIQVSLEQRCTRCVVLRGGQWTPRSMGREAKRGGGTKLMTVPCKRGRSPLAVVAVAYRSRNSAAPPPGCGCDFCAGPEVLVYLWAYYGAAAQAVFTFTALNVRANTMVAWKLTQGGT